ncbi:MAG: glycosyltransferase family 2 protein [Dongiaceae bacterium]
MSPTFSVIVPCYNAAATLWTALTSVLGQSDGDFEVIVVDDGSTDGSHAVAAELAAVDPRITVIRRANAGPSATRNLGIARSRGRFVAFLDADDRWHMGKLAAHRAHLEGDESVGVSFARIQFFDPRLSAPGRVSSAEGRLALIDLLGENPVCTTSNMVVRRELFGVVGSFDETLRHAEDQEWLVRVLTSSSWEIEGIDDVLVDYRTSDEGLSADLDRMLGGWEAMLGQARAKAPRTVAAVEPRARALYHRYLARRALRLGKPAGCAGRHLATALRCDPLALLAERPRRTLLTAIGVAASLLMPRQLLRSALSR